MNREGVVLFVRFSFATPLVTLVERLQTSFELLEIGATEPHRPEAGSGISGGCHIVIRSVAKNGYWNDQDRGSELKRAFGYFEHVLRGL